MLLETSPGHATRCVASDVRRRVRAAQGRAGGGRYRRARACGPSSKASTSAACASRPRAIVREGDALTEVDDAARRREGMFMIGQVAALRDGATSIADLHRDVTEGATALLDGLAAPESARPTPRPDRSTSRSSVPRPCSRAPSASTSSGPTSSAGSTASPRCRPTAGSVERYYDPEAVGARRRSEDPVEVGRLPARRAVRPAARTASRRARSRRSSNDQLLSLEVAAARPRRRRLRRPALRPRAHLGGLRGRDRHRPGAGVRLPGRPAPLTSARCPRR